MQRTQRKILIRTLIALILLLGLLTGCSEPEAETADDLLYYRGKMDELSRRVDELNSAILAIDMTDPGAPSDLLPKVQELTMALSDAAAVEPPAVCAEAHSYLMQAAREMTATRAALEQSLSEGLVYRDVLEEAGTSYENSLKDLKDFFLQLRDIAQTADSSL